MLIDKKRAVVLRPTDPDARLALAEALALEGQHEAAFREYEKALELDPGHADARRMLVRAYLNHDRLTVAERLLREPADDGDPEASELIADVYVKMARYDDALLYLDTAARRAPSRFELSLRAAELAYGGGLLELATEHARRATSLAPGDPRATAMLREIAQRTGDVIGATEPPLTRGPDFLLGRTLSILAAGRGGELDGKRYVALVDALRARDVRAAKRALVTSGLAATGESAWVLAFLRGEIAAADGEIDRAQRTYEQALAGVSLEGARAMIAMRLAETKTHLGDHAGARDALRISIQAKPTADAFEALGDALDALASPTDAEAEYRRARDLDPSSPAVAKLAALRAKRKHKDVSARNVGRIGALGWGGRGGRVSAVEAVGVAGSGQLIFTGNVGARGTEAAQVAFSCVKARAADLGLEGKIGKMDLHLHFSDTEVSKDGASAGVALALAAISALRDEELIPKLAATGEITVQGVVRPVAGLHEKLVAACLAGVTTVLLPRKNVLDIHDLPAEVRRRVAVHGIDSLPEAMEIAFGAPTSMGPAGR